MQTKGSYKLFGKCIQNGVIQQVIKKKGKWGYEEITELIQKKKDPYGILLQKGSVGISKAY